MIRPSSLAVLQQALGRFDLFIGAFSANVDQEANPLMQSAKATDLQMLRELDEAARAVLEEPPTDVLQRLRELPRQRGICSIDGTATGQFEGLWISATAIDDLLAAEQQVTRLEVIDEAGRAFTRRNCRLELSYQDNGCTLKIFVAPSSDGAQ